MRWITILPLLLVLGLVLAMLPPVTAASPQVKAIAAGTEVSYAVLDNGTVWAWGDNEWGQLGIGNEINQPYPTRVPIDRVQAVAVGRNFTLALKEDGTVWAWGDNRWGQLGDGTTATRVVPAPVKGLTGVKSIVAGDSNALALKEDGTVREWGLGWKGDSTFPIVEPAKVAISDVVAISSQGSESLALKADGTVWAWDKGDLSPDGVSYIAEVSQVPISNITAVCGGESAFALKEDGTIWTWGYNPTGQLGAVTTGFEQATPVRTDRLQNVSFIGTNGWTSFAGTCDGRTFTWGGGLGQGMQGTGERTSETIEAPEPVPGLAGLKAISVGYRHCLAIKDDDTLLAWGANDYGQIGNGLNATTYRVEFVFPNGTVWENADTSYYFCEPHPLSIAIGEVHAINDSILRVRLNSDPNRAVPEGTPEPIGVDLSAEDGWGVALDRQVDYITQEENGDLYAFSGNDIRCISQDGKQKWSLTVPDQWTVCRNRERVNMFLTGSGQYVVGSGSRPVYALSNGTLYLYVVPNTEYTTLPGWYDDYTDAKAKGMTWAILAISPDGRISWTKELDMFPKKYDDTFVGAAGDRAYVFQGYAETVLSQDGRVLFSIDNVATPAAVDEHGNLYVADARDYQSGAGRIDGDEFADFRLPGRIVSAYGPDGRRLWQKDLGEYITWNYVFEDLRPKYGTTPIYQDGTLYVAVRNGGVALDTDGNVKWSLALDRGQYRFFPAMPVDSKGNVYIENQFYNEPDSTHDVYVIGDHGKSLSQPRRYEVNSGELGTVARDGIVYDIYWDTGNIFFNNVMCPANLSNLAVYTVRAYDLVNDTVLWAYPIPTDNGKEVILDSGNFPAIFGETMKNLEYRIYEGQNPDVIKSTKPGNRTEFLINMYLDGDTLYVLSHEANYEIPVVFGQSKCVYASGLYLINTKGDLAYGKPLTGKVTAATVNNGTVFFATGDGVKTVVFGAVAGLALLGAIAIAIKFLLLGSVARSRTRLNKNDNRNLALAYVRQHPGSTMYEISRGMQMNMGTVRYHILILSMNHKITTFNEGKFVRYFPNSGAYSPEEQQIIALMRRDATGRIILALRDSPGLTNVELCERLGQPESAVSKLLKELHAKGVVDRKGIQGGRAAFYVNEKFTGIIARIPVQANG